MGRGKTRIYADGRGFSANKWIKNVLFRVFRARPRPIIMNLRQALRISDSACLALVGAGGKTTALFQLARELSPPVIVSATTHLHVDQTKLADSHWTLERPQDLDDLEKNLRGVMLVSGPVNGDRTTGLDKETLSRLRAVCVCHSLPLLIEADGSRQHPLKAPASHEPPIPDFVETVIVVAGLSGLGKPLTQEFVHRPEIFARLSSLAPTEAITSKALLRVLTHPAGGLKNIPEQARRLVLLNQAGTPELQSIGGKLAQDLLADFDAVILGTLEPLHVQTFEPIAGIILAAGEAKRFGQLKQLLDYRGQPFVRMVAKTALAAGLSPVVVVTGANAEAVEAAVYDLPITITRNALWQNGQSSSIQAGLCALPVKTGAAIFLLADQPQVMPTVIHALAGEHTRTLAPILAPLVAGQRANPVLFDRVTFPHLMELTGDVGGRAIFGKHQVTYLPWHDQALLVDVDTPEDFERLRDQE
jgi:molybdenum cofactor cytidylyltransferase